MAIQILVMTDDPSNIQGVIDALEDRRARMLVHSLDASLLSAAREASPAAILLDASTNAGAAHALISAFQEDNAFSSIPIFGLGAKLEGATSYYEQDKLEESSAVAAEILAIAELSFGFQGGDDAGLFEGLDQEMDVDAVLGPDHDAGPKTAPPPPPNLPPVPKRDAAPVSTPPEEASTERLTSRPVRSTGARAAALSSGRESLSLKQEILAKDREILALRSQVTQLEGASLSKEEELLESLENAQNLAEHLEAVQQQLEQSERSIQDLQQQLQEGVGTLEDLQDQNTTLRAELEEAQRQAQDTSKLEAIEAELQSVQEQHASAVQQRDEVLAISGELESALQAAEQRATAYEQTLEAADAAIQALRQNLGAYTEAAHQAREQMQEQHSALEALKEQFDATLNVSRTTREDQKDPLPESAWEESFNRYSAALETLQNAEADLEDAAIVDDEA